MKYSLSKFLFALSGIGLAASIWFYVSNSKPLNSYNHYEYYSDSNILAANLKKAEKALKYSEEGKGRKKKIHQPDVEEAKDSLYKAKNYSKDSYIIKHYLPDFEKHIDDIIDILPEENIEDADKFTYAYPRTLIFEEKEIIDFYGNRCLEFARDEKLKDNSKCSIGGLGAFLSLLGISISAYTFRKSTTASQSKY